MFGVFKSRMAPDGPVGFDFDIVIERPAGEVYGLIDLSDPRCAKRQLGTVEEAGAGRFDMRVDMLPDTVFGIEVTEAVQEHVYAFTCRARPLFGKLLHNTERYEVEPQGPDSCVLRLTVEAQFEHGLKERVWAKHTAYMAQGCEMALKKLKLHAEQGIEAVREIERRQAA